MGYFIIFCGISLFIVSLFAFGFWIICKSIQKNPVVPAPKPKPTTTTPPPPSPPQNAIGRNSLTGLDDGCMILLIVVCFCIFPPISILLVIL